MGRLRLYLDNCCYNRPYDDQKQLRISLETQAKLFIQQLIVDSRVDMASSYILRYENNQNPYRIRQDAITKFLQHTSVYVDQLHASEIAGSAKLIAETGIKPKDSLHVACAIYAHCDYFLTTDDRLLKYHDENIELINPLYFIERWEAITNDGQ